MEKWNQIFNKYMSKIFKSFRAKTIAIAIISLLIAMSLMIIVSYKGIKIISNSSLDGFEQSLNAMTNEYLNNYISTASTFMEEEINGIVQEQAILGDLSQRIMDMEGDFIGVNQLLNSQNYFEESLSFNGKWYQNYSDEESALLVQRYLLDVQNKIKPEVQALITETVFMDLLLPSFKKQGVSKQWVYYTGPKDKSFIRVAPWFDIGTAIEKVYPEYTDEPNWEYFNPGLVNAWETYLSENPTFKNDISKLSIISEPSQDGGTGEMIITIRHPLWNLKRDKMQGAISYDVPLTTTLSKIEDISLGNSGFAFLTDSNKNVIAINEIGMRTFGLEKQGITAEVTGYNRLNRRFELSEIESVQKIELPKSKEPTIQKLLIEDETYIMVLNNFSTGLSYNLDKGIYENFWSLGYVVPEDEFYSVFHLAEKNVVENTKKLVVYQLLLAFVTMLLMAALIFDFNRGATRDLEKLLEVTEEIKNRNYDVEIDIVSNDEFGRLAIAFRSMIAEIKLNVQQLFEQNQLFKEEIDERKRKERIIDYLESYDSLTNLPNASVFMRTIDEQILLVKGSGKIGAVIVLGIDNFRRVNEVYSHKTGDEVLKAITERFSYELRTISHLSKLNGDEFGIIINHLNDIQELAILIEQILSLFNESFKFDAKELFLSVSIGVSTFPSDGMNSQLLYKNASSALVNAKMTSGNAYKFFDNEANLEAKEKLELLTDLRHAIEGNEFVLNYQPIVDVRTERWIGMEALIRWRSEKRGMVAPSKFIAVAEESNLIVPISRWVIRKACSDLKIIHRNGFEAFRVSINISPYELKEEGFVEEIITLVTEMDIPPKYISLEITEGVFIDDFQNTAKIFRRLREFGVRISVDDFGTGYSSLSYIKKLEVNALKIDQSFIKGIPSTDEGTIANIINNLAKELQLKVVAEGVETIEQLTFLKERDVEEAQGYYFSVPLSIDKFSIKLIDHYEQM